MEQTIFNDQNEETKLSTEQRQEAPAQKYALAQERWTQQIRRRMEEYGDPDSPLPVWPIQPPDVPLEELKRIHALIEKEFEDPASIRSDAA